MRVLILLFLSFFLWNLSYADEIPKFSFYQPLKETELQQFLMSEKFDGVRGIWNGKSLQTRKENVIVAPKFWIQNFPPFILDGELWLRHNAFEETLSIVSSAIPKEEQWRQITFQIFDVRGVCEDCTLQERLQLLREYLERNPNPFIQIIPQIPIQNRAHLEEYYQGILRQGGEGVILRNNAIPNLGYKLKPFVDSECVVVDYTQGKGKFAGKMGAVVCEAEILGEKKQFKIGSGFSQSERENPPKIGTMITYKYQGYTKNGIPRFPVFLRVRGSGI